MQCFYLVLGAATFLARRQCFRVPETTLAANSVLATLVFPSVRLVTIIFLGHGVPHVGPDRRGVHGGLRPGLHLVQVLVRLHWRH